MSNWSVDASAFLALVYGEPGAEEVARAFAEGATMSAPNLAEVVTKLTDLNWPEPRIREAVQNAGVEIANFDAAQAYATGLLRRQTRTLGLSLGDRACLALAAREGMPALTAERNWARLALDPPIEISLIR